MELHLKQQILLLFFYLITVLNNTSVGRDISVKYLIYIIFENIIDSDMSLDVDNGYRENDDGYNNTKNKDNGMVSY